MLSNIYKKLIIDFSKITLILLLILIGFSLYHSKDFNLDASSDALLLEGDKDLKYLREINDRYGAKEFLFLTYTPANDFSDEELKNKNLFIEVEKKKYSIELINKPLKQTDFKNN